MRLLTEHSRKDVEMTSRERVLLSLNHRRPDRVPGRAVELPVIGYLRHSISKTRASIGLEPRSVDVYDPIQRLAICHDDVLDRLA